MKKVICIIILICILISLCACGYKNPKQIAVAESGYTCNADVFYGDNLSINAAINAIGGGIFSIRVNSPKSISGICFSFDNNEMTVSLNNALTSEGISTKYGGFAQILNEVFLKFITGRPTVYFKNGTYCFEGNSADYSFMVVFNEQGFPVTLAVPEEELTATFSNWEY